VVAVANGEGIRRIFRSLGVRQFVSGGQSLNPSTAQILEALAAVEAPEVVLLPNNDNIHAVAGRVDALTSKQERIIPTATIVEGFAALLAYDPAAHVDANAAAMEASAAPVVPGEVTRAVRYAVGPYGPIRAGDWLGISRAGIQVVSPAPSDAGCRLLDLLVEPGHTLVTIFEGEASTAADTRRLTEWLHEHWPDVDIEVHHGGQPLYPYLFSIE
jgi:dihydroxyacetone kinase-like predicted kinase